MMAGHYSSPHLPIQLMRREEVLLSQSTEQIKQVFLELREVFKEKELVPQYYGEFREGEIEGTLDIVIDKYKGVVVDVGCGDNRLGERLLNKSGKVTKVMEGANAEPIARITLTQPVCTQENEKIALSRRVDKHWRLIGWGEIRKGNKVAMNQAFQVEGPGSSSTNDD